MPKVLLIGTFETKRQELAYLSSALRWHGLSVDLMDISLDSKGSVWSGAEKLAQMAARAEEAAGKINRQCKECAVAVGVGGGTGGEIVLAAMRGLPSTYPKILITTLAFDPRPALADSSITILPTLCDIEGLNTQLRQVFENAAAAIAGLTKARGVDPSDRKSVAVTTLGATGRASEAVSTRLIDLGFESTVFHANGYGGAAFVRFVNEGYADAVIDLNVHELGRTRLAGAHVAMPERFSVANHLPRIVLPGALNFLGLGSIDTVSADHLARPNYRHTVQFTHVKLTAEEMTDQAEHLAVLLNRTVARCQLLLPMGGFSHQDRAGGAIEDPELREIAARILTERARTYEVTRLDSHINAPETATAIVAALQDCAIERTSHDRTPRPA